MPAKKAAKKTTTTKQPSDEKNAATKPLQPTNADAVQQQAKANQDTAQAAANLAPGSTIGVPSGTPVPPKEKKGDVRLFEVSPGVKVWLTEAEATDRGFFWLPDPKHPKA